TVDGHSTHRVYRSEAMPILYVLLFLTGDTKGQVSWNVAEVAQSRAACEEKRKEKAPEAVQKVPPRWTCVRIISSMWSAWMIAAPFVSGELTFHPVSSRGSTGCWRGSGPPVADRYRNEHRTPWRRLR